ncbi:LYR motif-containing protein At3g19508 [Abrus precatorius]|uniref:LYR motif-containing protein At3g19508 n=1 Tax=Abrus precatorius TaxID=3816 RepID=A0A8B8M3P1_ABRPR|nr:LYR motif-containing protein At3g19508 [Abrus precatorius]
MQKALRAYAEVLRLVRLLPKDSRPYYAKYVRENFVNYREIDASDSHDLFQHTYNHSLWVLHKYSVDKSAADKLKDICRG